MRRCAYCWSIPCALSQVSRAVRRLSMLARRWSSVRPSSVVRFASRSLVSSARFALRLSAYVCISLPSFTSWATSDATCVSRSASIFVRCSSKTDWTLDLSRLNLLAMASTRLDIGLVVEVVVLVACAIPTPVRPAALIAVTAPITARCYFIDTP